MFIRSSVVVLWALGIAFFPRVVQALGMPSMVNFIHFAIVPLACLITVPQVRTQIRKLISLELFIGSLALLAVMIVSTFLNDAGLINLVVDYLLLVEPFLLLLAIVSIPVSLASLKRFQSWVFGFAWINLLFALVQGPILRLNLQNPDYVKGVFLNQGSGHVVGASVSMTFAIYYFAVAKRPLWLRALVILAALVHTMFSDAKQVLAVFLAALLVLLFTRLKEVGQVLRYLIVALTFVGLLIWAANTIFPGLATWADIDTLMEGYELKQSVVPIVSSYYHSPLNWWFGLGPGHTVGRLGGWMIREYADLLNPLGVTSSPATNAVWKAVANHWLGDKSSMYSPLFGWAGIWGDLGFLGLAAYLYLCGVVWVRLCWDDLSRFIVLTVVIFGLIFSQLEEPGYMLFVFALIALHWQEHQVQKEEAVSYNYVFLPEDFPEQPVQQYPFNR
jgi:hypothetical protein